MDIVCVPVVVQKVLIRVEDSKITLKMIWCVVFGDFVLDDTYCRGRSWAIGKRKIIVFGRNLLRSKIYKKNKFLLNMTK